MSHAPRNAILAAAISMAISSAACAAHPNFVEPDVEVLYALTGEQAGDAYGWVADPIGDLDGDGAPDFVTSAPFQTDAGVLKGKAYVHSGATGAVLHTVVGNPNEFMGYAATAAGDVNADGTPDYILGTRTRAIVLSGADHSLLHEWVKPGEGFGFDAGTAGDLDGDGHDDVVIGAPFFNAGSGRVYAYSGRTGEALWHHDGGASWLIGTGVGPVGDVNGDGVPDVVTAAHGGAKNHKGVAWVLSGVDGSELLLLSPKTPSNSANGLSTFGRYHCHGAGDVDADGIPDIFVGDYNAKGGQHNPNGANSVGAGEGKAYVFSGADGEILLEIEAENFGDGMGPGRGVPDVNGDGHDDVYVAAWQYGQGENDTDVGKGYLVSGADGAVIRTMTGKTPGEYLGVDALSVGDVNADGKTDFIITGWGSLWVIAGH